MSLALLEYHLERRDSERWLHAALHNELARTLRILAQRSLQGEAPRNKVSAAVDAQRQVD
ncbi:MAG: hypothetical protein R3C14_39550 [Caldilineaceae bacterium]